MRTPPPALLPILRSRVQGDLLALTYLNPDAEYSLTDLSRSIGASVKAVHQEVDRLVANGFLADRRLGQLRLVRAATDTPVAGPLTDLLAVTYGPRPVLTAALSKVSGIDQAFIYGSWAARYTGQPGPPPGDVDILVLGQADPDELDDVAAATRTQLHREVSIRQLRPDTWERGTDPFVKTVQDRPLVELPIHHEKEQLA